MIPGCDWIADERSGARSANGERMSAKTPKSESTSSASSVSSCSDSSSSEESVVSKFISGKLSAYIQNLGKTQFEQTNDSEVTSYGMKVNLLDLSRVGGLSFND